MMVMRWLVSAVAIAVMVTSGAHAQSIGDRVAGVREGKVRLSFTARPGVCGNGRNIMTSRSTDDWESTCEGGPVRVVLRVRNREVIDLDTYVGGRWRSEAEEMSDLGAVPAPAAAAYLLHLVRTGSGNAAKDAVFAATLADTANVWPDLLAVAKDATRPRAVRRAAVFWVGQEAAAEVASELEEIVDDDAGDLEVREHAVFALSQRRDDGSVDALLRIARTHPDARIRKKALFWLGQSDDPRALELFEEILTKP
jgi:HEAT repeat protein